jgi:hypothetical protein
MNPPPEQLFDAEVEPEHPEQFVEPEQFDAASELEHPPP